MKRSAGTDRQVRHALVRIPDHTARDDRAPQRIRLFRRRAPTLSAATLSALFHSQLPRQYLPCRSERRRA